MILFLFHITYLDNTNIHIQTEKIWYEALVGEVGSQGKHSDLAGLEEMGSMVVFFFHITEGFLFPLTYLLCLHLTESRTVQMQYSILKIKGKVTKLTKIRVKSQL